MAPLRQPRIRLLVVEVRPPHRASLPTRAPRHVNPEGALVRRRPVQPDGRAVERAVVAIESLAPASECFDPATLTAVEPMPGGQARAAVEAAVVRVSSVRAARLLGKTKDSVALAETVTDEARRAAWRPLVSDALLEWGAGLERLAKYDDAHAKMVEGLELAVSANDARQAFAAAVALAYLDGVDRQKAESGATWVTLGRALLEPAQVRGSSEAIRLANVEAVMAIRADKAADAVTLLTALEKDLTALGMLHTANGARLITNLGGALRESGHPAEGVEASKRSLEMMEDLLSPNHPDVAAAVNNVGSALADLERLDEAAPYFRRSITLREALFGPDGLALATPHDNLGELAFRRGDGKTALEEYGRARAIVEKARGPDEDDVWDAKMGEALALGLLGRHAEAVATLDVVLPELVKRKLPAWNLAQAKLGLAGALKALGKEPARVNTLLKEVLALPGRATTTTTMVFDAALNSTSTRIHADLADRPHSSTGTCAARGGRRAQAVSQNWPGRASSTFIARVTHAGVQACPP